MLGGAIPATISNLTKLEVAKLHCNNFSGVFPTAALAGLTELRVLDFGRNPLTGAFPALPRLSKLEKFSCNFCALSSAIPPDVFLAHPSLVHTFWDGNALTGSLPPSLASLKKLQKVSFDINSLSGAIPAICDLEAFGALDDCRIGADTDLAPYQAAYPWIIPARGNLYRCPVPSCAAQGGLCNASGASRGPNGPPSPVRCA